jgi:drug/metabolite transporter (DMT)-like permease
MNTSNSSNSTSTDPWGFVFLLGSSIFYGSNYLPVKKFETGDGLFFQLVLCIGIWIVGFFVNIIQGFPQFFGLPLLGGFFWVSYFNNNCVYQK